MSLIKLLSALKHMAGKHSQASHNPHTNSTHSNSSDYLSDKAEWNSSWNMGDEVTVSGDVYHAGRVGKLLKIASSGILGTDQVPSRVTTDPQSLKSDVNWDAVIVMDGNKLGKLTVQSDRESPYAFEHELYAPGKLEVSNSIKSIHLNNADLSMLKYSKDVIQILEGKGIPVYANLSGTAKVVDLL